MADTILGAPKKVVVIGGAIAAGVLAYAYYKSADAGTPVADPLEAAVDEYDSPLGNSGGNSSLTSPGNVDEGSIRTNADWTNKAVETLQGAGWEGSAIYTALGKLLAFKTLSPFEADIAQAAKAAVGEPPVGGPYPIKEGLPTPDTSAKPSAPRLHHVNTTKTAAILQWSAADGAASYTVYQSGGKTVAKGVKETSFTVSNLKPGTRYSFSVASVNSANVRSSATSNVVTVTTKK